VRNDRESPVNEEKASVMHQGGAKRVGKFAMVKKINLATNPPQGIFAGVYRLRMATGRIPFAGWQNCEARFS